jgi:hypothetical protein
MSENLPLRHRRNYISAKTTGPRLHAAAIEVLERYQVTLAKPGETLAKRLIEYNRKKLREMH